VRERGPLNRTWPPTAWENGGNTVLQVFAPYSKSNGVLCGRAGV
jgi:hypothetical protein